MFTGLIETVGTLSAIHPKDDVWKLDIVAPKIAGELRIGDSVSISGACSTVVRSDSRSFSVEIMEETRIRTKLGSLRSGSRVNLERAMRLDSRLDGHIVSGHIDGLAYVSKIEISPKTRKYYFEAPPELLSGIVQGIRGDRRHKPHGHRRRCGELFRRHNPDHDLRHDPLRTQRGGCGEYRDRYDRQIHHKIFECTFFRG